MSLFSIRRQMDDLMNQMMLSSPMMYSSSLFDSDPFFSDRMMLTDDKHHVSNTNSNKDSKQEVNLNYDKNKPESSSTALSNSNNSNTALSTAGAQSARWGLMKVDVHEEKDKFIVSAELPGVSKDQVKVSVDNGYLTISGDKKEEHSNVKNESGRQIRYSERRYGEFQRSLRLPNTADVNNIHAKYDNGVLTLDVPKLEKPESKTKSITIN